MIRRSKQWALLLAAAFFAAQLVSVFHVHEAEAASDSTAKGQHRCEVCQFSRDIKTFEETAPPASEPVLENIVVPVTNEEFIVPHEKLLDFAPRVPPFIIST